MTIQIRKTGLPMLCRGLLFVAVICGVAFADGALTSQAKSATEDFPVVINNGPHPAPPRGAKWKISFKEDLTIGVKEGDEDYMLGERVFLNVDDKGDIYIVDWDRKRIQKYGPDGKYLLTFGRKGQGPGEFEDVWMPHFDREGNIYVRDYINQKIVSFDCSGKLVKETKMPGEARDVQVNSRGEYLTNTSEDRVESDGRTITLYRHGLYDKDLNPLVVLRTSTWTSARPPGDDPESQVKFFAESMSKAALKSYATPLLGRDDRIYVGSSGAYEIRVYSPSGKSEKLIRKDQPPQPVTEMHRRDAALSLERHIAFSLPQSVRKRALSLVRYPKYLPAYLTFTLMDNGWLAVVADALEGGAAKIDFFDQDGIYVAEATAHIPVEGLLFKKDKAYAIKTTEDGYRFVKRYLFEVKED